MKLHSLLVVFALSACAGRAAESIPIHWIDAKPTAPVGVTLGVPWPQGAFKKGDPVTLADTSGAPLATQSWPLAYWPDGSVKWIALAAVASPEHAAGLQVLRRASPAPATPVRVFRPTIEVYYRVETGPMIAAVGDRGTAIIQEIRRGGRVRTGEVNLVARRQRVRVEAGREVREIESFLGIIQRCTVEQSGPVRAVLKIEGVHRAEGGAGGEWLPYTVRLVFWAGLDRIDVKHTFIFDGDPTKDFVAGLGLRARVALEHGPENHFVRVTGEDGGAWCEPVRMLPVIEEKAMGHVYTASPGTPAPRVFVPPSERGIALHRAPQFEGQRVEPSPEGALVPSWGEMQLLQDSADSAVLRKRTAADMIWVDVARARRVPGVMALGTPEGSFAVGIRNFWQAHPTALQCSGAEGPLGWLHAWLWSPDSAPMGLRHYIDRDTRPTYEAVNPDVPSRSSAHGIARTSELTLFAFGPEQTNAAFAAEAASVPLPPQPACLPEWYHRCGVFGDAWTPVDTSTPARARLESELSSILDFYVREVDQRHWYGFWNFGDVMHSYDKLRHQWLYDTGGYAWDNSEMQSDQWLWWSFFRTGRSDVFRLAEAMTRHVSEVDTYHLGPWAPLGTRHGVTHWGDPCKEPRITQAQPKRFMYYLTADERTGDLLDETLAADRIASANAPANGPFVCRVNSDWWSHMGAWLTAWERTGEPKWRDRIVGSIDSVLALPRGLLHANQALYDPETGRFKDWPEAPFYQGHLAMIFGGSDLAMELAGLLRHEGLARGLEEYGRIYSLPKEKFDKLGGERPDITARILIRWPYARLAAWGARSRTDPAAMRRAWALLLADDVFPMWRNHPFSTTRVRQPLGAREISEGSFGTEMMTNTAAQWSLNTMTLLAYGGDVLTDEISLLKP